MSYEINLLYHAKQHVLYIDSDIEETKQVNRRIYEENFLSERRSVIKWCKRKSQEHGIVLLLWACVIDHDYEEILITSFITCRHDSNGLYSSCYAS